LINLSLILILTVKTYFTFGNNEKISLSQFDTKKEIYKFKTVLRQKWNQKQDCPSVKKIQVTFESARKVPRSKTRKNW